MNRETIEKNNKYTLQLYPELKFGGSTRGKKYISLARV